MKARRAFDVTHKLLFVGFLVMKKSFSRNSRLATRRRSFVKQKVIGNDPTSLDWIRLFVFIVLIWLNPKATNVHRKMNQSIQFYLLGFRHRSAIPMMTGKTMACSKQLTLLLVLWLYFLLSLRATRFKRKLFSWSRGFFLSLVFFSKATIFHFLHRKVFLKQPVGKITFLMLCTENPQALLYCVSSRFFM